MNDCKYDESARVLSFDLDRTVAVNVGTTLSAIGLDATPEEISPHNISMTETLPQLGQGDLQFLKMTKEELSAEMAGVSQTLLTEIRKKSSGELKKGQSRNFSETPDNFWYVIVQPRIDQLSITVRGPVGHFKGHTNLDVKDDRGNTRFKVRSVDDIPKALTLIFRAIRKT